MSHTTVFSPPSALPSLLLDVAVTDKALLPVDGPLSDVEDEVSGCCFHLSLSARGIIMVGTCPCLYDKPLTT
jgi:hypothetical protein